MVEKRKLNNRVFVTEDDMSTLLERYHLFSVFMLILGFCLFCLCFVLFYIVYMLFVDCMHICGMGV